MSVLAFLHTSISNAAAVSARPIPVIGTSKTVLWDGNLPDRTSAPQTPDLLLSFRTSFNLKPRSVKLLPTQHRGRRCAAHRASPYITYTLKTIYFNRLKAIAGYS